LPLLVSPSLFFVHHIVIPIPISSPLTFTLKHFPYSCSSFLYLVSSSSSILSPLRTIFFNSYIVSSLLFPYPRNIALGFHRV
jgi:hypothetical protein